MVSLICCDSSNVQSHCFLLRKYLVANFTPLLSRSPPGNRSDKSKCDPTITRMPIHSQCAVPEHIGSLHDSKFFCLLLCRLLSVPKTKHDHLHLGFFKTQKCWEFEVQYIVQYSAWKLNHPNLMLGKSQLSHTVRLLFICGGSI